MVVAGVAVGMLVGYLAGSGVIGKAHGAASGRNDRERGAQSKSEREAAVPGNYLVIPAAEDSSRLAMMSVEEIIARLTELDPESRYMEILEEEYFERALQMHHLVRHVPEERIESLLDALYIKEHDGLLLNVLGIRVAETLIERLMGIDSERAIHWARATESKDVMETLVRLMAQQEPATAVAFIRSEGLVKGEWGRDLNILNYAVALGPAGLLAMEDVIGKGRLLDALKKAPAGLCSQYADVWLSRTAKDSSEADNLRHLLKRWGGFEPGAVVAWYQAKLPDELRNKPEMAYSVMESMIESDPERALEFVGAEFEKSPAIVNRLFGMAIRNHLDPELWDDLAERFPAGFEPRMEHFRELIGIKGVPYPGLVLGGARCFKDPARRMEFLRTALETAAWKGRLVTAEKPAQEIERARTGLEEMEFSPADREEVFRLFEAAAEHWREQPPGYVNGSTWILP